jgi:MOSC domain-containing protein YiiM
VTAPRLPCGKLAAKMGERGFQKRFSDAGRAGAYLRVIEEGEVAAGDAVELLERPAHGVTVALVARALGGEGELVPRLLDAPQLAERTLRWARSRVAAAQR